MTAKSSHSSPCWCDFLSGSTLEGCAVMTLRNTIPIVVCDSPSHWSLTSPGKSWQRKWKATHLGIGGGCCLHSQRSPEQLLFLKMTLLKHLALIILLWATFSNTKCHYSYIHKLKKVFIKSSSKGDLPFPLLFDIMWLFEFYHLW